MNAKQSLMLGALFVCATSGAQQLTLPGPVSLAPFELQQMQFRERYEGCVKDVSFTHVLTFAFGGLRAAEIWVGATRMIPPSCDGYRSVQGRIFTSGEGETCPSREGAPIKLAGGLHELIGKPVPESITFSTADSTLFADVFLDVVVGPCEIFSNGFE